jgi:hypothetical protein
MDRAKVKLDMWKSLIYILEVGLTEEIKSQRAAIDNPLVFGKWVRDCNAGLSDRLKFGAVLYKASLPIAVEEKLNLFLDAGFHPLEHENLKNLARIIYEGKCAEVEERLKITVPRSTYALIVPDWIGTLGLDEIYMHSSTCFVEEDEFSPLAGLPLQGMDVLVARSPAHYASDIQRVKAVSKPGLAGYKDVIVFSTRGIGWNAVCSHQDTLSRRCNRISSPIVRHLETRCQICQDESQRGSKARVMKTLNERTCEEKEGVR